MFRRDDRSLGRRKFLQMLGSTSTAAMAVAAVSTTATQEAQAYDPGRQETRARYRADSADVQAFYRTNGYETLKK
jgi:hypothetical protein